MNLNQKVKNCCVRDSACILDAMRAINDGAVGIALVVDEQTRLKGVLTDGDIRRGLIKGVGLDSPVAPFVNGKFTALGPEAGRTEILDLMQARHISQIPIVEADGRLIGLHLLTEILGSAPRPNWAVIMAGGKGTRLRPLTENLPKPMIKVAGRPILERLVLHLVGFGITRIFLSINYLGHVIEQHFGDGAKFGCRIEYLREEKEMGTGGALALLPEKPSAPLLVMNGDLVTQVNVHRFLEFHETGRFAVSVAVRRYFHQIPFGCVEVAEGKVARLDEKPMFQQLINAGAYVVGPAMLSRIPSQFFPITNLIDLCLQSRDPVGAWEVEEDWLDVGQKEQLQQAREGTV